MRCRGEPLTRSRRIAECKDFPGRILEEEALQPIAQMARRRIFCFLARGIQIRALFNDPQREACKKRPRRGLRQMNRMIREGRDLARKAESPPKPVGNRRHMVDWMVNVHREVEEAARRKNT